jgi:hypothetical protein
VAVDVIDRLLDGGNFFGVFVGDFGLELFFQRHDEFDRIERVGAKVIDEGGLVFYFCLVYAQLLGDDFLHTLFNIFHLILLPSFLASETADHFTKIHCQTFEN